MVILVSVNSFIAPGSDAWRRLMSASKIPTLFGVNPFDSPLHLYMVMRGECEPETVSSNVANRVHFEPAARSWFEATFPDYRHDETQPTYWFEDWAVATPDFVYRDNTGARVVVEVKTTLQPADWCLEDYPGVPVQYVLQVMWQMLVSDTKRAAVVVIHGYSFDFSVHWVRFEPGLAALLVRVAVEFMERVDQGHPPGFTFHELDLVALRAAHKDIAQDETVSVPRDVVVDWFSARDAKADAAANERAALCDLLHMMGNAQHAECKGIRVASRRRNSAGSVSLYKTTGVSIKDIDDE